MTGFSDALGNIGNVLGGAVGIASAFQGLQGAPSVNVPTLGDARKAGAGFRSVSTPSLFVNTGGQDIGLFRTSGLNPGALEAAGRAQIGQVAQGLQGLRGDSAQQRVGLQGVRGGLSDIRSRSGALRQDVESLRTRLGGTFADLQGQVKPGFGGLTDARVKAVRDRRDEAVGNLRESLSRRKVLGSSFAADALTRTELAFAQEEEGARAQSFVEELGLSRQLAVDEAAATGQLGSLAGNLLGLDAQSLAQETQTIGLDMGLTQQDAGLFAQEMVAIQQASNLLAQTTQRELSELGFAADIANGVNTNVASVASINGQLALLQAQQQAANQSTLAGDVARIGGALSSLGSGLGGLFG